MARPKKPSGELGSVEECNAAMQRVLLLTLQLEGLRADRDQAIAQMSAKYEPSIDKALAEKQDIEAQLQQYYMAHLREVEKDGKRSLALYWGTIGRRATPPALRLLNKSWTWRTVLVKLREKYGSRFLRMREPEPDKDLVKAELDTDALRECGLKLDQDEVFFCEPDRQRAPEIG